jgi:hypothetical protein
MLEQEAAQGKRSLQETAQLIAQEENLRENATAEAIRGYDLLEQELQQLGSAQQDVINRQKQLFFASERAKNGFTTMSGSMTKLTSNTKGANIAFANFGRIVQDAPFGLLGISNNIDPLLNSFNDVKKTAGGAGAAFKEIGSQLLGPAGLIFLIGSALPTALLFLQRYLQDTKKETESVTQAVKSLQEQTSKGFADAAARVGIDELNAGLAKSTSLLTQEEQKLKDIQLEIRGFGEGRVRLSAQDRERVATLREQRDEIEAIIEREKINVESFKTRIALLEQEDRDRARYSQNEVGRAKDEEDTRKAREEDNKQLLEQFKILDPLLSLQLSFNEAIRESRDAYLAQALAVRIASQAEARSFQDRARRQGRDTTLTDDADYERGLKQREALERIRIESLRRMGQEEQAITLETEIAKRDAVLNLLKLGITDQETIDQELANIEQEGANRTKDNELTIADARAESMRIYADAFASGIEAVFGKNKAIQSAQVVIDTYAGAQKAFAALAPNLPLQIAASGAVVAQGIAALRKINSTTPGTRSIGRSGTASSPTPQGRSFVNDLGAAGQVAGTIGPFGASMTPNISITANLDRQGLALAVRDGESDIATRQIPFAS